MLSLSLIRQLDRNWLAALGLLGACGPLPPAENATESTTGGPSTDATTAMTSLTSPTTGVTTGPTDTTTGPPPECVDSSDCGTCSFCDDGVCRYDYGGCCYYAAPGGGAWRCSPPYDWCNLDEDCPYGYVCDDLGYCIPGGPPPTKILPSCPPGNVDVSAWDLMQLPRGLGLGDLDGDGDLDLFAALPAAAAIELAFNDGAGVFTPGTLVDVGPAQSDLRVAGGDLDGDGDLDLAVARADSSDLIVLFGQDGMFMPGPLLPASATPRTITAADVDGDGDRDLVTFSGDLHRVSAWLGDGVGGFGSEKILLDSAFAAASTMQRVDSDGASDLLTLPAPDVAPFVTIFRGTADGSLEPVWEAELPWAAWTQALAGDLGSAPLPEVVALRLEGGGGMVRVWPGIDEFQWTIAADYATASPLLGGALADFDGDANLDLVSASGAAIFSVLHGDGNGGFSCEQSVSVEFPTLPEVLAVGDVDGSPGDELVVGSHDSPTVLVIRAP